MGRKVEVAGPDCHPDRPYFSRGLCRPCYLKAWRRDSLSVSRHPQHKCGFHLNRQPQRFWEKVDSEDPAECWIWKGHTTCGGYGRFRMDGHNVFAHRFAYESIVGPIPDGLPLDHLCRNRACVNPAHLEPVTHKVNILRGESPSARNATKTHCKRGHIFDRHNTYHIRTGGRACKQCMKERKLCSRNS